MTEEMVTATSTYQPPTKRQLEENIIIEARELARRKWWQEKSHLVFNIKRYASELNERF